MNKQIKFILPPKNLFVPNDPIDDPSPYYYRPIIGFLYRQRIQNGLDLLEAPYESILEFGYGSGLLLPTLHSMCNNLSAIDTVSQPSRVGPALDMSNLAVDLKRGDITEAHYRSNSFDLIVSFSVFEHIASPEPILKEMSRILKNRGHLLVGMPRVSGDMEPLFTFIGYKNINKHHITSFRKFLLAANAYFSIKKQSHMPSFMPSFLGLYFNVLLEKRNIIQ